jgi:hypothetical protein
MRGSLTVDGSSTLFPEFWSMYVAWISSIATVCLQAQQHSALRVMASAVEQVMALAKEGPSEGPISVAVTIFQFPDRLQILGEAGDALVIRDARALLDKISLPNQVPPTELVFDLVDAGELEGAEHERPQTHTHILPDRYVADLWGYMIAGAYERNESAITSRHGPTRGVKNWPLELQVFHHVRNAAFHGGRFNIWKNKNKIDYARPPHWRGYTIASEDAVAGRYAIGDFLPLVHVLPFVREVSITLDGLG